MSLSTLMNVFVNGIIRRSQGRKMDIIEVIEFIACRIEVRQRVLMGQGMNVINVVMQTGDKFLRSGNAHIALNFYREAIFLFPGNAICHIREGQSLVSLGNFDEAKEACEKAIDFSLERDLEELPSLIDIFTICDRLHNAHGLYSTLMNRFPQHHYFREKVKELKTMLRNKEKQKDGGKKNKTASMSGKTTNTSGKNVGQRAERKTDEVTTNEEWETLRKQEEKEMRKRKEQKEKGKMSTKQEKGGTRRRKERKDKEEVLRKDVEENQIKEQQENEEEHVAKKPLKNSDDHEVMDSKATQSNHPPFFKEVKKKKDQLSNALNEMPNDYDHILFSGSCLRRVCPTCNIPLLFLAQTCNSCKNRVVNVWYKNVDTDSWTNPRKPPRSVPDSQPYVQCQNFAKGKKCVDIPCRFAHGQDEIEIWKLYRSLDIDIDEPIIDSAGPSTSSVSFNMHGSPGEDSHQSDMTIRSDGPIQTDKSFDRGRDVGESHHNRSDKKSPGKKRGKNKKSNKASLKSTANRQEELLRCKVCDARFPCWSQLECHYSDTMHRVNIGKKTQSTKFRPALQKEPPLIDSFSEKVRRRIVKEGAQQVLKKDIPGVMVNCRATPEVKPDEPESPQAHTWTFDVRIKTDRQLLLKQVSFLWETHLDKFSFLRNPTQDCSPNINSIQFLEKDFVENTGMQELTVQFSIHFSSDVFGDFKQKLVFDFGPDMILVRSLFVSVISKNICSNDEDLLSRTRYCCILEWSEEKMELVPCKDLLRMDVDGLCEQYSIPDVLPDPSECVEFTRETYCKHWHDILFTEEEYIQREVARYNIQDGEMKIINSFQASFDETVYAPPGEFFGEIYLSDYLVMDEVAGNIINRSVLSVVVRPKGEQNSSQRVYECYIKKKTSELIIIKVNEVLCKDYVLEKDQVIYIDVKFRYNRLLMCEMHHAIDLCERKTGVLPSIKNVSCKHKVDKTIVEKPIPDLFMMMDRKPNTNQRDAIAMILDPSPTPPILVIGPFGTGKTFTLNLACVSILNQSEGSNILICTRSNSAANIHLQHLDTKTQTNPSLNIRPLRILTPFRNVQDVPATLRKYCLIEGENQQTRFRKPTWDEIRDHNVIITTLATARMLWKFHQNGSLRFTHILIDEAAQALEPECVIPLVMADKNTKIVLAGDQMQMSPPAYSNYLWPKDCGPKRSLIERLFSHYKECNEISSKPSSSPEDNSTYLQTPYAVLLRENYRCHAEILQFPSDCFYGGKLVARGDQRTHNFRPVLSFYTALGEDRRVEEGLAYYNLAEVAEIVEQVEELIRLWPEDWGKKNIGVLTPYRDQVKLIRKSLRKRKLGYVDVETVENAQGKEFRALFISTVRTRWTCWQIEDRNVELNSDPSELDFKFLSDKRLLNTAMTRAQSLLAVVGDPMSLCSIGACKDIWKQYLQRCHANKGLYGCTLKIVMDFCLSLKVLDPNAHEFTPGRAEEDNQTLLNTSFEATDDEEEDNVEDDSIADQSAIDNFFHRDGVPATENFDKIIEELVKACQETKKKDELREKNEQYKYFNSLNNDSLTTSSPRWSDNSFCGAFWAGLSDGKIELGFHIEPSERLFRLTAGKFHESLLHGDNWSHDVELTFKQEELLNMINENPTLFKKCTLRVNTSGRQRKYYGQLPTPDSSDIQILGRVRGVYEDDIVVLKLEESTLVNEEGKEEKIIIPEFGQIQGVLRSLVKPERRKFVCKVDQNNPSVMIPRHKSLPKLANLTKTNEENVIPIYLLKKNIQVEVNIVKGKLYRQALVGERVFVVKYRQWNPNFPYPLGLAIRHMPQGKDFKTGMDILYEEYNIRRRFSKKLNASVAAEFDQNWQVSKSERGRDAYRGNVFTVDPPESQDLDDAISVKSLGNGNYRLHVHIADVSYFVQPGTELDEEAKLRGTSYYPPRPEANVPMLPRELSERCCSLLPGKDRLAVTVSFKVTPDGTVVEDPVIKRSMVCSSARLTYSEAQQIINAASQQEFPITDEERQIPVNEAIGVVHRIAQGHRRLRLGVQRSLSHRKKDNYDDYGHSHDHHLDNEREAHQMIEEIMIMTNHWVAKHLLNKFPECTPLRVQPPPKMRHIVEWRHKFLKFLHFSIGLQWLGEANIAQQAVELKVPFQTWHMIIANVNGNYDYRELVKLVCDVDLFPQLSLANSHQQKLHQRGRYISSGEKFQYLANDQNQQDLNNILYGHWSLCLDAYCHFTSPIRRYIDIIVHRLVVAAEYEIDSVDPNDITEICDYCTFIARNSSRFNKEAKNLRLAVNLESTSRFVSAYIEEVSRDALTLFFGTGEFEHFPSTPVPIAHLRPERDPEEAVDSVTLQWTFRFLRLHKHISAQPKVNFADYEMMALAIKLERQKDTYENVPTSPDIDFDYTVSGDLWNKVMEAIREENEDKLKSCLQEVDEDIKKRGKPKNSIEVRQKTQHDPKSFSRKPCGHTNVEKTSAKEAENDEFLEVIRSFKPYDRVKVQMCSRVSQGVLSPIVQLFEIANKIFACVEHRSSPTTCFAITELKRPRDTLIYDVETYVKVWKPVLMMEMVTSAVQEGDVVILSNLLVSFVQDSQGSVTMEFNLSYDYSSNHFLAPLELNLMCVRVKDPDGSGEDNGYWIGHFQISELLKKKNATKSMGAAEFTTTDEPTRQTSDSEKFQPILARLISPHSTLVPESFIKQRFCYVTAEMILLSSPNRRCYNALNNTMTASRLIQDICTPHIPTEIIVQERELPQELSLAGVYPYFHPLNRFQRIAVKKALTGSFTPIQGPPGTGKTVTGVHIAYWFAQLNQQKKHVLKEDGATSNASIVFFCGPSNKSVDVVARFLKRIPDLKILRIYGQEVERKVFPIPDQVTQFRSKRVSAQLKADKDLQDVSLHHVIRSAECPFAKTLKEYDEEFKTWPKNDCSDCAKELRKKIKKFKEIKSKAEKWAINQNGVEVILITCTAAYGPRIVGVCESRVSQCIIDECGMCIEAETLCAMLGSKANQVVLIGDHKQLQPVIKCKKAREYGLGISMFERFSDHAQMLEIQYRMHKNICEFPSVNFYDGRLKTAEEVQRRDPDNVTWPNGDSYPFAFHHVEGVEEALVVTTEQGNQNSKKNQEEIEKVIDLARGLTNQGIEVEDIVILSPYRAQCFELKKKLETVRLNEISVMSVVEAQGSEKNYVILSLVRSLPLREIEIQPLRSWVTENLGFVADKHQINVALTRAKRGLRIVGNANLLEVCKVWKKLLNHYKQKGCFVEED